MKLSYRALSMVLVGMMGLSVTAFAAPKTMNLDLATAYAADAPAAKGLEKFVADVAEKTNGAIDIALFTDGTLGTPKDNYTSLASGDLDLACTGLEGLDLYAPEFTFLSSPFLIKDMDHLDALLNSEIGEKLAQKYAENNIEVLAWHKRDVRNFSSNKPVSSPADVSGLKLRLPGMTTYVEGWGALNVISTSVSMSELYMALQTGVAEASEGGYEQMVSLKLYEVQKYLMETEHVFEHVGLYMNKELFDSLSEEQQKIIKESAKEAMAYADQLSEEARAGYKQQCIDGGMQTVEVDRDAFVAALADFHKKQFETKWTGTTYEEVMSYAK